MLTVPVVLNLQAVNLTDEQFHQLCQDNRELQLERNAEGALIIMPPVGGVSGNQESELNGRVWLWNENTKLGKVFSSSTIFRLPRGGDRSPDVAWVRLDRWNALTPEQQERFPPLCPDFVIELRSRTDSLELLQEKMQEYLNSGLQLGWLINPQDEQVEVYQMNQAKKVFSLPAELSGEPVLPGFMLHLPI